MLAATYEASAEQHRKEQDQNILDTKKVYEDLKIRLGETFRITDEQNVCIWVDSGYLFHISHAYLTGKHTRYCQRCYI